MDRAGEETDGATVASRDVDAIRTECAATSGLGGTSREEVTRLASTRDHEMGVDGHRPSAGSIGSQREGAVGE